MGTKIEVASFLGIAAIFELRRGEQVTVAANQASLGTLQKELLAENVTHEEVRQLAQLVASISEEVLFMIRKKTNVF